MISVGVYGGTGYMGGEVMRIILQHPEAKLAWATSRSGGDIAFYHPNLYGTEVNLVHPDKTTPCDVVFLAIPTEESIAVAAEFLRKGCKVIDLGSAFRLKDRDTWETVYKMRHVNWELAEEAVCGVNELHQKEIAKARLVEFRVLFFGGDSWAGAAGQGKRRQSVQHRRGRAVRHERCGRGAIARGAPP